tara:strand:+ start:792 stop:1385 length:594 start_codon:yes stop_codon:yes gene_type:complete
MKFFVLIFVIISSSLSFADDNDACDSRNSVKLNISSELKLCSSKNGVTIIHYENIYNYKFINHIESQFYIINSLPTGFLCRDGILTGRHLPPPKYKPNNGIYLYKLENIKNKLVPIIPPKPESFKIRKYLMNYKVFERRKLQALALVIYNGKKNINNGRIILFPKEKDTLLEFKINKCRVKMTDQAIKINKYTMRRD